MTQDSMVISQRTCDEEVNHVKKRDDHVKKRDEDEVVGNCQKTFFSFLLLKLV